ncbi:MAG: T9SS type A sorting domain-containing protein [Bacteroidetes bacterium]|nr:T9SS type A sorting domain-containing protein [Bacteroidota bacterium]
MKKSTLLAILMMVVIALFTFDTGYSQVAFTEGNLVVYRVGDGVSTLANTGNPVFLDEYTTSGTLVQSVPLPTTVIAPNQQLVASGTASSEGCITRSADGKYILFTGYGANIPYATSLTATASTAVPRVIGIVGSSAAINTTTALTDAVTGSSPRSATSTDGNALWLCGGAGGARYTTKGSTTSTQISTTLTNLRVLNIFNNQLYTSSQSGAFRLATVGTGLPTTSGQTIVNLPGFPTSTGSPYGYFFADLDAGVTGMDVVYVADDGGTLQKYSLVAGSWTANGSISIAAIRGLTGSVSGTSVTLYGSSSTTTLPYTSNIISLTDASGYNATITGTSTVIATLGASSTKVFRGIAFAPVAGTTPTPVVTVAPTTLSGFTYVFGSGPSAEQLYTISGSNLTANISVAPPVSGDYEISTGTGGSFVATNPITLTQTDGSVATDTIYVRLKAGLAVGSYNSELVTASSTGATSATVTCSGTVTDVPLPSISVSTPTLTGFTAILGSASDSQPYTVSGDNLTASVTVTAPTGFEVSTDNTNFLPNFDLSQSGGNLIGEPVTVHVRIAASAPIGAAAGNIAHTSASATTVNVSVSGSVIYPAPTNQADLFTATSLSHSSITNTWLDNDGTQPATGFLIMGNTSGIFTAPSDGVAPASDATLSDGSGLVYVLHGAKTFTWNGLPSSTHYYFAIYAYTNTGTSIKYKTATVEQPTPTANATTQVFVLPVAAWTFDATAASPNTPTSVSSNFGDQAGTAALFADSTNGSSLWLQATELNAFAGSTTNDPRESGSTLAGMSYCPIGGTLNSANGKSMVIKFSMSALQDPILTYATRYSSSTGFNSHLWAWSTDGTNFVSFGTNTAPTSTTFVTKTLDMSAIDGLDGAPTVYLRLTLDGAAGTTSNNRLDNIVSRAAAATTLKPTVFTTAATAVGATTATINGTVNANNQATTVTFEYGLGVDTTTVTTVTVPGTFTGASIHTISANLPVLDINTEYNFRIIGDNGSGTSKGFFKFFTTTCPVPADAGEITGPTEVCANPTTGYQYSVPAIANATSYVWSFPPSSEVLGEGNVVTVYFPVGVSTWDVSVFGTNACGDGNASNPYTVTLLQPDAVSVSIAASANPVAAGTSVTFTATPVNEGAAPTYVWKVNGSVVGTSSITYAYIPLNNDVVTCQLTSSLACTSNNPATSDPINMVVTGIPTNLDVTGTVSPGPLACYNAENTITVAGGSTTFEVLLGGDAEMIAGVNILYLPGTKVNSGGHMHGHIGGPFCTPVKASEIASGQEETGLTMMDNAYKIYPNPTSGLFTIEHRGDLSSDIVKVEVLGTLGAKVLSTEFQGLRKQELSIKGNPQGIYFVKVMTGDKVQKVFDDACKRAPAEYWAADGVHPTVPVSLYFCKLFHIPGLKSEVSPKNRIMKKNTVLTFIISVIIALGFSQPAFSQLLLEENFSYPADDLITAHGWTAHSAGAQPITVNNGGLNFTDYIGSGIGNAALVDNTGEDDSRVFPVQTAGVVYTAFMLKITTTAAGYFFHLGGEPIGTTFRGKVFMDATNHFGLSLGSNTGSYATTTYTPGNTYLIVLKYEIVSGTANDIVSLFVFDTSIPSSEPATPTIGPLVDAASSDINPGCVALRQFSAAQNFVLDGIRVGMSWTDILPAAVVPPTVQAHDLAFSGISATGITASWTNGNGAKRIALVNTTNSFSNPADGTDPVANPVYGGVGQQVVYNGTGNSIAVTGLSGSTTYWFRVYEYNGTGSSTKYLTTTATLNPASQTTSIVVTAPTITLPTVTSITSTSAQLGGNITSDGGSVITGRGTVWKTAPGVTITDNKLAEGGTASGVFSHMRSSLSPQTLVYFKAYATNVIGTTLSSEGSFFTLSNEPTSHVTGFSAVAAGNTSINLTWTAAASGASGYLILQKNGTIAPTGIPVDGTGYTTGNSLGDATIAALVTPGSALNKTITGLSSGTPYSFTIIPFNWDNANNETYNYFTTPAIPAATATTTGTASTIYTWVGADNGAWTTAANWTPVRSTPTTADILQFTDGTTKTVTAVPTQTIARLVMAGNTIINLQSSGSVVLTISGAAGPDLEIPAGCALNLNANNIISIVIATTATGSISGNMKFSAATAATAHRLTAADPGAIVFNNGAIFTAGTFFSGNPFGTASYGSVIFSGGSIYLQQAGSNPFGAGQPNSVVIFQTGSLFKVMANLSPSFSGRTYANFEMDFTGATLTTTGTAPVSIDNLTITNGTLNFNMTGPVNIKGNILVQPGANLNFTPASAATVAMSGSTPQSITLNGTMTANANTSLEIANSSGVSLNSSVTLNGNLELTSGLLSLGSNNLILAPASAIIGTPSSLAMVVATGTGKLQKGFITGFTGSFVFPVGDNTGTPEYSPVALNFSSGTFGTGNYVSVNLVNAKFPGDPNTTGYLNRYWNVASSGITSFLCSSMFQYVPADVTGNETQLFSMQVVPAPFTDFGLVNSTLHQVNAPGLTTFGTFTGSQPKPIVVTKAATLIDATTATLNGEVTPNFNNTAISFEYGLTTAYGTVVPGSPASVTSGVSNPVLANIIGLTQNTTYHFRIKGTNVQGTSNGSDMSFTTLCPAPLAAGTISGPANVCKNGTGYVYTVPAVTYATSYFWTVPAGANITSGTNTNSITVSFSASAVSGNITVYGTSACGNGSTSPAYAITVVPQPVPTINGPANACINSSGNLYATETGMTGYTWTVSAGGMITGGSTTNSILVNWTTTGPQTITVSYTNGSGCTAASPVSYPVTVIPLPTPVILGPNVVCANAAGIVYTTEAGMTNYNWAVSIGGTIVSGAGTNAITVLWPYPGNRTVSVAYTNATGCAVITPTVYNVTINPAAVPTIGSSNTPCINSTNNQYYTNTGMSNYLWNISPGGIITSGQGTNTIYVTWNNVGAQWVNVSYTNSFGCNAVAPTVYDLFVNPLPNVAGPITGTASLCAGTNGVAFSCDEILNASSYGWTLPAGATIASGSGTNSITVNFGASAVSGNITVAGINSCGNGTASPNYSVTVNAIPGAPVITVYGTVLTSSSASGNQWYYNGNLIPGATGQSYTVTHNTGYYWCMVTINGCSSPISNKIWVVITGQQELENSHFSIYPVPSNGLFTVAITSTVKEVYCIQIYNQLGSMIYKLDNVQVNGTFEKQIDLRPLPNGIYSAVFSNGATKIVRKLLINN